MPEMLYTDLCTARCYGTTHCDTVLPHSIPVQLECGQLPAEWRLDDTFT